MTQAASSVFAGIHSAAQSVAPPQTSESSAGSGFASAFGAGLHKASDLEAQAQSTVMDLLRGGGVEVHDAMIATQQSELTFELALQVRNKAVAAYQQMMQMQF